MGANENLSACGHLGNCVDIGEEVLLARMA